MCCLKNEELAYEELNSHLPNVGEYVKTPEGLKGEVQSVSVLKQRVRVIVELDKEEKEVRDYDVKELKFKGRSRDKNRDRNRGGKGKHDSDLEKLEQMEKNDGKSKLDD